MQCDTEHCSRLQQSRYHAVIEGSMIPFAAYTAADSQCFSMGRTTPKIVHSLLMDLEARPHLIHDSLCPTHRHTDHATSDICSKLATGRI